MKREELTRDQQSKKQHGRKERKIGKGEWKNLVGEGREGGGKGEGRKGRDGVSSR